MIAVMYVKLNLHYNSFKFITCVILVRAHVFYVTYQVQRSSAFCSGEEDVLNCFTIYGRGGHLHHVTKISA